MNQTDLRIFISAARRPSLGAVALEMHSDGWRDEQLPRKIRYWADDLQLLLHFVKSGRALAYLPDFALADADLMRIDVTDSAYACSERVALVWNHVRAPTWLRGLAQELAHA